MTPQLAYAIAVGALMVMAFVLMMNGMGAL